MRSFLVALAILVLPGSLQAQVLYVDAHLTTGSDDGTSWGNAFQGENGVQAALRSGQTFTEIYVTGGQYRTSAGSGRGASFHLGGEVQVFGGFNGGESHPEQRPSFDSNPSILTGDLLGNDVTGDASALTDNAYHVVRANGLGTEALLDGFTIRGGNANGFTGLRGAGGGVLVEDEAVLTVRNCRFDSLNARESGGGAHCFSATLILSDTHFEACSAGERGGAVSSIFSPELRIERCVVENSSASNGGGLAVLENEKTEVLNSAFFDNQAAGPGGGGGLYLLGLGRVHVIGCTIAFNTATSPTLQARGGVVVGGSWVTVRNSILWGNSGYAGSTTTQHQLTSGVDTAYCTIEGGYVCTGCSDADPQFVNPLARDLRLTQGSPALDAGDPGAIRSRVRADVDRRRREVDDLSVPNSGPGFAPHPDLGAFERSSTVGTVHCTTNQSAFGRPALLDATGSSLAANQNLTLTARLLPSNTFAFFLTSRRSGFAANPAGSFGNICLGGAIGRFVGPGQIMNTGPAGVVQLDVPLHALPTPTGLVPALPGDSWFFQAWFRETMTGVLTSNLTDAVRIRFE